jgi:hypothetical protein
VTSLVGVREAISAPGVTSLVGVREAISASA